MSGARRPWRRRPKRKPSTPQPVGKLLDELLVRRNLQKPLRLFELQRRWPELVGAVAAARSWPDGLRDGVLTIYVADSTWVQELTYLKVELLAKVQSVVTVEGARELRFFVRAGAAIPRDHPSNRDRATGDSDAPERPLPPDVAQALDAFENDLDSIDDPDLRKSIRHAFVEHLLNR